VNKRRRLIITCFYSSFKIHGIIYLLFKFSLKYLLKKVKYAENIISKKRRSRFRSHCKPIA